MRFKLKVWLLLFGTLILIVVGVIIFQSYPTSPDTKVVKPSSVSPKSEPEMPIIPTNINPPPIIPVRNSELVKSKATTKIPISLSQSTDITAYCTDANSVVTSLSPTFNADVIKIINEIKASYQGLINDISNDKTKQNQELNKFQTQITDLQNQITPINSQIEKNKPRITALDKDIYIKREAIEQSKIHNGFSSPKTGQLRDEVIKLMRDKELAEKEISGLRKKENLLLEQIQLNQEYEKKFKERYASLDESDKQLLDEHISRQINKHFNIQK
ncbi:hypothetical protein ATP_00259 [Candidatus Phytoplasma mali]|uniref:Uncharacterized protein n=1 Tax=Phytoplasma mali (strain AT) TaxID=482235 RepID=B3QZQ9_PHYMT|nr:hypothetical protein [Candidatus Phytoplasma mali]CAP18446.1 hypothetical protein ATP_00259 [Candidatus Phytoplasma mali]